MTLVPGGRRPESSGLCLFCGTFSGVDAVLNVVLFVPLGVALGLARVRPRRALLVAGALSVLIELLQLTIVPGRDAAVRDVITNACGGALGAWLAWNAPAAIFPSPRRAARLVAFWGLSWLAIHVVGAWTMQVALPDTLYYGQRQRVLEQFDPFPGRLLEGAVDGKELPDHADMSLARIRSVWRDSGFVRASARVIAGPRATDRIAPIVSIFDERRREILVLGQWGAGLAFRVETHARDARLRPLTFELMRVFPGVESPLAQPGDTVEVQAELRRGVARLWARRGASERAVTLPVRATLAWANLLPFELPVGPWTDAGSLLWLFASVLPAGYWVAMALRDRQGAIVGAMLLAALVAGLWMTPLIFGLPRSSWLEWMAAGLAALAGGIAARRVLRPNARCPSGDPR